MTSESNLRQPTIQGPKILSTQDFNLQIYKFHIVLFSYLTPFQMVHCVINLTQYFRQTSDLFTRTEL